jgi:predicted DNA-binding transcriptional regulator
MKEYGIYVHNSLVENKHLQAMGITVWLYLWLLDKMTSIDKNGNGKVLGGKPVTSEEITTSLGINERTLRRWVKQLSDGGYITTTRTPVGLSYTVTKAKKIFKNTVKNFEYDPEEISRKMSQDRKGNKHYNWQGGKSSENSRVRMSFEYRQWRTAVFERDGYICQKCNKEGGSLEAHHIKQFAHYPELRFEVSNGMTLCKPCHIEVTKADRSVQVNGQKVSSDRTDVSLAYRQYKDNTKTIGEKENNKGKNSPNKEKIRTMLLSKGLLN